MHTSVHQYGTDAQMPSWPQHRGWWQLPLLATFRCWAYVLRQTEDVGDHPMLHLELALQHWHLIGPVQTSQ